MPVSDLAMQRIFPYRDPTTGRLQFVHKVPELLAVRAFPGRDENGRMIVNARSDDPDRYADGWIARQCYRENLIASPQYHGKLFSVQNDVATDWEDCWPLEMSVDMDGFVSVREQDGADVFCGASAMNFSGGYTFTKYSVSVKPHSLFAIYRYVGAQQSGYYFRRLNEEGDSIYTHWTATPTAYLKFHARDRRAPVCWDRLAYSWLSYATCPYFPSSTSVKFEMSIEYDAYSTWVHDGVTYTGGSDSGMSLGECTNIMWYIGHPQCQDFYDADLVYDVICADYHYYEPYVFDDLHPTFQVQGWHAGVYVSPNPAVYGTTLFWSGEPCTVPGQMADETAWIEISNACPDELAFCFRVPRSQLVVQVVDVSP